MIATFTPTVPNTVNDTSCAYSIIVAVSDQICNTFTPVITFLLRAPLILAVMATSRPPMPVLMDSVDVSTIRALIISSR
jgi:hypothetical protein